jgi:hypothetical protein
VVVVDIAMVAEKLQCQVQTWPAKQAAVVVGGLALDAAAIVVALDPVGQPVGAVALEPASASVFRDFGEWLLGLGRIQDIEHPYIDDSGSARIEN